MIKGVIILYLATCSAIGIHEWDQHTWQNIILYFGQIIFFLNFLMRQFPCTPLLNDTLLLKKKIRLQEKVYEEDVNQLDWFSH